MSSASVESSSEPGPGGPVHGQHQQQQHQQHHDGDAQVSPSPQDQDQEEIHRRHVEYQQAKQKRQEIANYIFSSFSGSSDEGDNNDHDGDDPAKNGKGGTENGGGGGGGEGGRGDNKNDKNAAPSSSSSSWGSSIRSWRKNRTGSSMATTDRSAAASAAAAASEPSSSSSSRLHHQLSSVSTTDSVREGQLEEGDRTVFSNTLSTSDVDDRLRELGLMSSGSSIIISPTNNSSTSTMPNASGSPGRNADDDDDDPDNNAPGRRRPQSQAQHEVDAKISIMVSATLELVQDLCRVRPGDCVMTQFGQGVVVKQSMTYLETDVDFEHPITTLTIKLDGCGNNTLLYTRQLTQVHKILDPVEYNQAMEYMEHIRKLQLAVQCQQWNVPVIDGICVACLFQKPYTEGSKMGKKSKKMKKESLSKSRWSSMRSRWSSTSTGSSTRNASKNNNFDASSSSTTTSTTIHEHETSMSPDHQEFMSPSISTSMSDDSINSHDPGIGHPRHSEILSTANKATTICDVCGHPVCSGHIMHNPDGSRELFVMCVDCSFDLTQLSKTLGVNHPQLQSNLDRLLQYYTRMVLQLSFCVPNLKELAENLTEHEQRHSRIAIGTNAVGFVGAALGVAGAATLLTPAGPAILLAAIATQATSGVLQGGHAIAKTMSSKDANKLADRCLGWYGLCLSILQALETLRSDLIRQRTELIVGHDLDMSTDSTDLLNALLESGRRNVSSTDQALQVWNTLSYGTYQTTRQGLTGVAISAQMGASHAQILASSIQAVPVVGAAFSVGCMAMDAGNIASNLGKMQKPHSKSVALNGVVMGFAKYIGPSITGEVEALVAALTELREKQQEAHQHQETDLIEKELEELSML
eukprot:CAMPEP_0113478260 /NCGR_PEP_ID=MMETSP0014_2-20120614/20656_1 /TAXON_ID=2857 /ORGANISM="Nitzschia sp." /LENGTH=864 /DNA_ID=CAMNT_0000371429 /DNA_START=194 /DNA_END=2787 /DNA_ORIENTATION=+ /assembly_acc=CAM_ASM_000159